MASRLASPLAFRVVLAAAIGLAGAGSALIGRAFPIAPAPMASTVYELQRVAGGSVYVEDFDLSAEDCFGSLPPVRHTPAGYFRCVGYVLPEAAR